MGNKAIVALLVGLVLASVRPAEAQPKRVSRIGFLWSSPGTYQSRIDTFRHGLRDLGYVEGQNIVIEYRYTEGRQDLTTELAEELVHLKVDLIVAPTTPAILAIKKASSTIPIVFASISDPVASGFVASLARPGGNMTGINDSWTRVKRKKVRAT
jgi:putative tryptophan/tyrosine transport system substrate-binding protein